MKTEKVSLKELESHSEAVFEFIDKIKETHRDHYVKNLRTLVSQKEVLKA
jgi:hypothetical protein